jgi:hypothetical protein
MSASVHSAAVNLVMVGLSPDVSGLCHGYPCSPLCRVPQMLYAISAWLQPVS